MLGIYLWVREAESQVLVNEKLYSLDVYFI
jgi:hypothetical protein